MISFLNKNKSTKIVTNHSQPNGNTLIIAFYKSISKHVGKTAQRSLNKC